MFHEAYLLTWTDTMLSKNTGSKNTCRDSPGDQWLRLHFSMQGEWVPSLVGELKSYMPPGQKTKTQNRINIVTNLIKTLKMVHIKKKIHKKESHWR